MQKDMIYNTVNAAASCIAPVWPIKTFIACNPLQGLESKPFEEAFIESKQLFRLKSTQHPGMQLLNQLTIKWCGVFFDEGQAACAMPNKSKGLYAAFRDVCGWDAQLHQHQQPKRQWLCALPETAKEAIALCLDELKHCPLDSVSLIRASLLALPGWSGYVKWHTDWRNQDVNTSDGNALLDFVAMRLIMHVVLASVPLSTHAPTRQDLVADQKRLQQITAAEGSYCHALIQKLMPETADCAKRHKPRAEVQMVFCIDVRSEPFRRCIETNAAYETLGFAGFFGLPVCIHDYNTGKTSDACPVLLKPTFSVADKPIEPLSPCVKQHLHARAWFDTLTRVYQNMKYNLSTPFSLVETLGFWSGFAIFLKTVMPVTTLAMCNAMIARVKPEVPTEPELTCDAKLIELASQALHVMGLTDHFAKVVVFCGHGSRTQNNAYASGLDCGACGGNHGGMNAKILAAILNQQEVRAAIADKGIVIPSDTYFIAAEHDTTTDSVQLYQPFAMHAEVIDRLSRDLVWAKAQNTAQRTPYFGACIATNALLETQRRADDWSEVRPEWGLARNAAFIVAPRALTRDVDLEGRCFLHSYPWEQDTDGDLLETILTAPMVVAEWINMQYLFSTVDNVSFGSGSKITHNIVGKLGVMQGNASDLMHGLPLQSVKSSDGVDFHQPQRLLTVIYAPKKRVEGIIQKQDILQRLFYNGWVNLVVIDPTQNKAYQLGRTRGWHVIGSKESR